MKRFRRVRAGISGVLLVLIFVVAVPALAQGDSFNPEVAVLPQALERISWGAVLAGAVVALVTQLTLNLLAVAIGASTLNPAEDDSASVTDVGKGTVTSMALIMLASLFLGGWMAARFAGNPERLDGVLHGLIVWGLVTLATMLLLTTTVGRFLSGLNRMLQTGLRLAGSTAQTVGTTVAHVAQDAARTAGNVAQRAAEGVAQTTQSAMESPRVQQMSMQAGTTIERIRAEAMEIVQRAGIDQQQVETVAREAVQDVRAAVSEAQQNPQDIERIVANTLGRLFNRGRDVVSQVDREAVIDLLVERGRMNHEQAEMTVLRWENSLQELPQQAAQAINEVREQAKPANLSEGATRAQQALGEQVTRAQQAVTEQVAKVQQDIERTAREAAQSATDALAKLAFAAFLIVTIGAVAAGAGGFLGAPQELPIAEIDAAAIQQP